MTAPSSIDPARFGQPAARWTSCGRTGIAALIRRGAGPVGRWIVTTILVRGYRKAMFRCWRLPQRYRIAASRHGQTVLGG